MCLQAKYTKGPRGALPDVALILEIILPIGYRRQKELRATRTDVRTSSLPGGAPQQRLCRPRPAATRSGATGITAYLSNGGTLEHAQQIAGHASPKTTKLYDRTADTITVDEIERIVI